MNRESSSRPFLVVAAVLLVIALVLYPLSVGPAVVLCNHNYLDRGAAIRFYYPLTIVCDACPPLNSAMAYYQSFFEKIPHPVPRD